MRISKLTPLEAAKECSLILPDQSIPEWKERFIKLLDRQLDEVLRSGCHE